MPVPHATRIIAIAIFLLVTCYLLRVTIVRANHCPTSDLDCQIQELQREIDAFKPAHEKNKVELANLQKQLKDIKARISSLTNQLNALEKDITKRESDLEERGEVFEEKTRRHYMTLRQHDPLAPFLLADSAIGLLRELSIRQRVITQDQEDIIDIAKAISDLEKDQKTLTSSRASLTSAQSSLDKNAEFLEGEVAKVEKVISELSSKQEALIAAKAGGFQTSIGDTPPTLEPCSGPPGSSNYCNPGFTGFAAFSFGAPHRTGMSQYGAYGRSKSGQSAETILSAYFQGAELNKGYSVPGSINVSGYGSIPFEDNYLLGIYEVPESWGDNGGFEALKAQAVAARSYALYATNNGAGTICPTESCQVYKSQLKTGKWAEAVKATRGWVITRGGSPAGTYYSSTTGGYTISQWSWSGIKDTSGDWPNTSYEKVSGSPWFYKAWYKTRSGSTCGKSNPWLTASEMADIVNAWHVVFNGGGDASRVSPVDTNCWPGNPYSISELSQIGGYTSVSSVSVTYGNDGSTINVSLSTNKGTITIAGTDFKKSFNLRAPGYIGIKSSLFNIEKAN
ncbi:MAG: SpoIID/LytB domain-containing protein [Patescibacteria group bacterium]